MAIAFDYDSIKQRIMTSLSGKSAWSNQLAYSVEDLLVSPIAQELAYMNQYHEYLTFENWWGKARNKSSLLVEAPVHGYIVPRKTGAVGTLQISTSKTFDSSYSYNIPIPKYFQFSNGTTYVVAENTYILPANTNSISFLVRQGTKKSVPFLALGNLFETKVIQDSSIENSLFDLYVNDILWTRVDSLFDAIPTDTVYELNTAPDFNSVTIKFGNNIFGKKLTTNDSVVFNYISTLGNNGNILSLDNVTTVEDQAVDINSFPVTIYARNTTQITGGQDFPTIEQIRNTSPNVFQAGDRASGNTDYLTILKSFNFISKVTVWGVQETLQDQNLDPWSFIPTEENIVHIAALDTSYNDLTSLEQTEIITNLYNKNDPTDLIDFTTVEKINLLFTIAAVVKNSTYSLSTAKGDIQNLLSSTYSLANEDFNNHLYFSDFVNLISSISSIRNHDSSISLVKIFSFQNAYYANFLLGQYPIASSSIAIYIKNTTDDDSTYRLLATSNSNGVLLATSGFDTTGSYVNLNTGSSFILVNSGLSNPYNTYTIKTVYQSSNLDLLLNKRYFIFNYFDSDITVTYPTS